jgi:catechol-2,3-dioxygenase
MVDWEQQHIGLTVGTTEEFDRWLKRLEESGVPHKVVEGERIYFADPDGVVLELEVASPLTVNDNAAEVLARWAEEHN